MDFDVIGLKEVAFVESPTQIDVVVETFVIGVLLEILIEGLPETFVVPLSAGIAAPCVGCGACAIIKKQALSAILEGCGLGVLFFPRDHHRRAVDVAKVRRLGRKQKEQPNGKGEGQQNDTGDDQLTEFVRLPIFVEFGEVRSIGLAASAERGFEAAWPKSETLTQRAVRALGSFGESVSGFVIDDRIAGGGDRRLGGDGVLEGFPQLVGRIKAFEG